MAAAKPGFGKDGREDGRREDSGAQEGLPGGLLQGSDVEFSFFEPGKKAPEPVPTRIKMPKPGEAEKASKTVLTDSKEDRPLFDREPVKLTGSQAEKRIQKLQADLQEQADMLAGIMALRLPVTAVYTGDQSPKAIEALLNIARKRPKMLDALEKASDSFDAISIGKFVIGFGVAFQVDTGRLAPDSFPAMATGVTKVFAEHFVENDGELNNNVMSMPEQAHAVRFEPAS